MLIGCNPTYWRLCFCRKNLLESESFDHVFISFFCPSPPPFSFCFLSSTSHALYFSFEKLRFYYTSYIFCLIKDNKLSHTFCFCFSLKSWNLLLFLCRGFPFSCCCFDNSVSMAEQLGLLKVTIVRGKKLVIRDFKTSDPYVIVKLGNQTAKTKVINSCLNPVWNEELSFTLTEPAGVLKLEVFDKDTFKADDKMGHADLNLQPIVSAARLKQILHVSSGETELRKVAPDSDNCLASESSISCVDGVVVQNAWLRLRAVESGEIELKIKLINPPVTHSG
ncbi:hypothetical protein K2173_011062 [Erythroxylum novogranatense]|uniref:C2 domain-containing protein n=1 Tax=Erythroxylum novogranatense TaxID=1862640 RepID=A0AAV8T0D2_9ROSI|nr:hypothetical protein K2173_011062 [Erythroxylum novogranatense]